MKVANSVVSYSFIVKPSAGVLEGVFISDNLVTVRSTQHEDQVDLHDFISDEEAKYIALYFTGGGEITLCKLTYIHGEAEYEVGVVNGEMTYLIFIDGYTVIINRFERYSTPIVVPPTIPDYPAYPDNPQTNATIESAKSAAIARVGGGTVARVETKYHKYGTVYHVLIVNGDYRYCVHVNATTGYVINMHTYQITTVASNAYGYTAAVSANNAKAIAIQSAGGGGIVTECKLEYKKHLVSLMYHVHVAKGQYEYCVEINATNNSVLKVEPRYKP